ncbi:MAG: glycosyltransferase [Anaerolineae bacterium]|nr:glycosyltransferase [Anaerolineae bacterium]
MSTSPTIALITNDAIGEKMAGPGIRYWEFARVLSNSFRVKLIVPPYVCMDASLSGKPGEAEVYVCENADALAALVTDCDVLVTLGIVLAFYPFLTQLEKVLVVDIYDPFLLAGLQREVGTDLSRQIGAYEKYREALDVQLRAGDFFLCASERQRDYWLGMLSAVGRINPYTYAQDPTFEKLITVVPFGLPWEQPQHLHPVLKGVYKSIAPADKVLLWGGGVWDWLDAPALVRSMPLILTHRDDVKVFFMGTRRPNASAGQTAAVDNLVALSQDLDLYDRYVFFNDWVDYEQRQNYLLEADLGISLHLNHAETRFAFRTRLLDYLWAGLPTVCTVGDVLGESLAAQGAVSLVAPGDVEGLARTILSLLAIPDLRAQNEVRVKAIAAQYHWDVVAQPLADFCAVPHFAADRGYVQQQLAVGQRSNPWWSKVQRAVQSGGPRELWRQVCAYLHWRRQQ